jgi:NTP pyrophosphatase (non-canonical NTP hydrolase)
MSLTLTDYQREAATTAIYPDAGTGSLAALQYVALKLAEEAGEVAGKVGKAMRDGWTHGDLVDKLFVEGGDVLWYVSRLADELGPGLEAMANYNLDKLRDRAERGVLGGSGDNR